MRSFINISSSDAALASGFQMNAAQLCRIIQVHIKVSVVWQERARRLLFVTGERRIARETYRDGWCLP